MNPILSVRLIAGSLGIGLVEVALCAAVSIISGNNIGIRHLQDLLVGGVRWEEWCASVSLNVRVQILGEGNVVALQDRGKGSVNLCVVGGVDVG